MKNNNYIRRALYLRNSIAYDHDFWKNCVKWYISRYVFHFFKILIFWVVSWVKGQKMAHYDKKLCLSYFISPKSYIKWLSFLVHLCKKMISPDILFFYFFKIFIFWVVRVVKRQKNGQKWEKIKSVVVHILISFMVHTCKMTISPRFS